MRRAWETWTGTLGTLLEMGGKEEEWKMTATIMIPIRMYDQPEFRI